MFPHGRSVTVVRGTPGGVDPYGDPTPGTTNRTVIPMCGVAPRYSNEPTERGRAGVIVGLTLYAPPGTVLEFDDTVEIDGQSWTIEGDAGDWLNPFTGTDFGLEVALKRATG